MDEMLIFVCQNEKGMSNEPLEEFIFDIPSHSAVSKTSHAKAEPRKLWNKERDAE